MKSHLKYFDSYEKLSKEVAAHTLSKISESESLHIGVATGNSPRMAYEFIGKALNENPILIPKLRIFQLDEWLGLSPQNPSSCQQYLFEHIIRPWNLEVDQYFLLDGQHPNMGSQLKEMRMYLDKNSLDLCILGMGKNGHLAFNEPGSRKADTCRMVSLAKASKNHQMVEGLDVTLEKGITIGLKEIMVSKELLLIVSGEGKQEARQKLLGKAPISKFTASVVNGHANYSIYLQEAPD
ncbi:MAG: 6-phosphogluconolactonase [Flavobacteriaceae bacterium]